MNLSKTFYLVLSLLFSISFFYSLFDTRDSHELFFWDVDKWIYRGYRLLIALLFIKLYFDKKKNEKNQLI
ncbi:hypothetical protein OIU80_08305 [Flavobacterium sp. LS1R47]|uniref:Uncharacterized protein n=1 Tax=Flavobacterium frigoritolerans TaxID=2987686 RepID=A0A9X2YZA4_9FLAO|nr:hypothetical protein [Flavobacterium frigoritolerans]MCV9932283.1 hypothetical protein [Flavobacterium frigoritolerans]